MRGSDLIPLKGGFSIEADALKLAWALEDRGIRIAAEGTTLVVEPASLLTPEDCAKIRAHKHGLLKAARYCEYEMWRA